MEFFAASERTCKEECLKELGQSDIAIGIYGSRYGSIDTETGLSMTEVEFDYAIEHNIPVLAFVTRQLTEEKQNHFIHEKVFKQNKSCARFSTLEEFADGLCQTLKEYLQDLDGFSYESLWEKIKQLHDTMSDKSLSSGDHMKVYTDEDRDSVIQSMDKDIDWLINLLPDIHMLHEEVTGFKNIELKSEEVQRIAQNKWEYFFIGFPNVLQSLKVKISFLQLQNLQHRLLTEPWTNELRELVIKTRDKYFDIAKESYYVD